MKINNGSFLTLLIVGVLLMLPVLSQSSLAQTLGNNEPMGTVTIRITDAGLSTRSLQLAGGLYIVTVRNDSSNSRGLLLRGIDVCCSRYTRLIQVMKPGEQVSFRWFFPADRTVEVKDLIKCRPTPTACAWVPGDRAMNLRFS